MLQKLTVPVAAVQIASNKQVALMPPGRHRVEGEPGLYLYVSSDQQTRRWIFRFTSPVSKRVTETGLGAVPVISLADAKTKAHDMRKQIANGVCPINAKRKELASRVTFREVADQWIETHKASWKLGWDGSEGSQMKTAKLLLYHHGAPLANLPVSEVTPDAVQAALEKLWKRTPNQGRRTLSMWERVFDYAKAKGFRVGDNPCSWRGCFEYRLSRRRASDLGHHIALPYEQLPTFMKKLRWQQVRGVSATALEFTILTVARTGEVLGMQWEEINWDKKTWTVPKERMKAAKEHVVPLNARAMELLVRQKEYSGSGFVFEGYNRTRLADRCLRSVMHNMKVKASVHGFRSTFRDFCGDQTNFQREHVEACLAHQVGNSVELSYRRSTALEKRRIILDHWAEYCGGAQ